MSGRGRTLKIELLGDASDLERALGGADEKVGGLGDKLGAIGGAVIGAGAFNALEQGTLSAGKLQAQLGLTDEQAREFDKVSKEVYRDNFGDSMGEAAQVTGLVHQALGLTGDELKGTTEDIFMISDAFSHLGAEPAIVADNVRTMKAAFPDMTEAEILDRITLGYQQGGQAAADQADTLQEYPRFFSEIGLSGSDMMNFINEGMEAGARNTDLLGDSVKEMGILVQEEGSNAQERLKGIFGEDQAGELIENFSAGGEAGREAFFTMLEGLNSIEDPMERNQAAIDLFGTKGEDMAGVLDDMLPSFLATKDAQNEVGDATKSLEDQYGGSVATLEGWKRTFETSVIGALGGFGPQAQQVGSAVSGLGTGLLGLSALGVDVGGKFTQMGSKLLQVANPMKLLTVAQGALNLVMSLNPILIVVVALAALAAGLVLAYQHSETFRDIVNGVFGAVQEKVQGVVSWFTESFVPFFTETLPGVFTSFKDLSIGEVLSLAGSMLTEAPKVVANVVTGLGGLVLDAAGGAFGVFTDLSTKAVSKLGELAGKMLSEGPKVVANMVTGLGGLILDAAGGALHLYSQLVTFAIGKIASLASSMLSEGPGVVANLVTGLGGLILDAAGGALHIYSELVNKAVGKVGELASSMLTEGPKVVTELITGLGGLVLDAAGGALHMFTNLKDKALDKIGDLAEDIASKAQEVVTNLISGFTGLFSVDTVTGALGQFYKFETMLIEKLVTGENSVAKQAVQWGVDIVQGLIDGIKGMAGDLIQAIKESVTDKIPDFVKDAMGIDSPSRVMMGIGGDIADGLIMGIQDGAKGVQAATLGLAEAANMGMSEGLGRFPGDMAFRGRGGRPGGLNGASPFGDEGRGGNTFNVNVTTEYEDPSRIARRIEFMMRELAASPALAKVAG